MYAILYRDMVNTNCSALVTDEDGHDSYRTALTSTVKDDNTLPQHRYQIMIPYPVMQTKKNIAEVWSMPYTGYTQ